MNYRIAADIGGTFTDLILEGGDGQIFEIEKVLTTPDAPDDAVLTGIVQLLRKTGIDPGSISHVLHGTTLFTNALIERKGARTALITTKGFRDAVEIGREHRFDMYDLHMRKTEPLAARHLRFEVDERVLADGSVGKTLHDDEVRAIAEELQASDIEAVAVTLIHSYRNDSHERRIGEILSERLPNVAITLSSRLVPEIREYDRTSTTLANVYVKRIAEVYLNRLRCRLKEHGMVGHLFVMQSNGGLAEAEAAWNYPIRLIESGAAAGALAAAHYGTLLGHRDLLSFDMGGTTAKSCVIADGEPLVAQEFEIDRQYQFKKGSGLPVKVPVIEMIEIGTGGGSIARIDAVGRLRIGPQSAGAKPGPACYGFGGTEPTVTDADLALGYLNPKFFLGGRMELDSLAAAQTITEKIATPLRLDLLDAAWGIHQLANESMASAARVHAIERGKDPSQFPVFAFGGAGPVHGFGVAKILRSPGIIYPLAAGVMSSVGFLTAPLMFDFVRSMPAALEDLDLTRVHHLVCEMEDEGRAVLGRMLPADSIHFHHFADMRYRKQGHEIRVSLPNVELLPGNREQIQRAFERAYAELYGHTIANTPVEVVSWRVVARGPRPKFALPRAGGCDAKAAVKEMRKAYLPGQRELREVPVYDRYAVRAGTILAGPAILEEREATVVINGTASIHVDEFGNLSVNLGIDR